MTETTQATETETEATDMNKLFKQIAIELRIKSLNNTMVKMGDLIETNKHCDVVLNGFKHFSRTHRVTCVELLHNIIIELIAYSKRYPQLQKRLNKLYELT